MTIRYSLRNRNERARKVPILSIIWMTGRERNTTDASEAKRVSLFRISQSRGPVFAAHTGQGQRVLYTRFLDGAILDGLPKHRHNADISDIYVGIKRPQSRRKRTAPALTLIRRNKRKRKKRWRKMKKLRWSRPFPAWPGILKTFPNEPDAQRAVTLFLFYGFCWDYRHDRVHKFGQKDISKLRGSKFYPSKWFKNLRW